uniref:Gamma-glutamyltransferase 5a n=1 Tax=Sphaeramia orbicularis TaxID=375764 RepID=A0A673AY75_9TELE
VMAADVDMLLQGGSAVDGAIAALLCTFVVNPQSMGIGGGSIITIRDKTGKVKVYNFRETIPRRTLSYLVKTCKTSIPLFLFLVLGSQWIGIPGEFRGYEAIHNQYGRLRWSKLFEPTIKLARDDRLVFWTLSAFLCNNIRVNSFLLNPAVHLWSVWFTENLSWLSLK